MPVDRSHLRSPLLASSACHPSSTPDADELFLEDFYAVLREDVVALDELRPVEDE